MGGTSGDPQQATVASRQLRVFINYRHEDAWGVAMLLYERLVSRFGRGNVFLDARNLQPGMNWRQGD